MAKTWQAPAPLIYAKFDPFITGFNSKYIYIYPIRTFMFLGTNDAFDTHDIYKHLILK